MPARVQQLNRLADQAMAARRYEQAISMYTESLSIAPVQAEVLNRLASARVLLRQIYVDRIYDLVDGATKPVGEFVNAWQMSARLPSLEVKPARVTSIRIDLSKRFSAAEPRLRSGTEAHRYFRQLGRMQRLVADDAVAGALIEVAGGLRRAHLDLRRAAEKKRRAGLALLHTVAAAQFSPSETGLWSDANKRRAALLRALSIPIDVQATTHNRRGVHAVVGGVLRRLPVIFRVERGATLRLVLETRRPQTDERRYSSRHSAQCQVGTRDETNPQCPALKRRTESSLRTVEGYQRALQGASARCAQDDTANSCISHINEAERRLRSARRDYETLERQLKSCPRTISKPVFRTFFYKRETVRRQADATASLTLFSGSRPLSARPLRGVAQASDTHGDGLSCANIATDTLQLPSSGRLLQQAEQRMLDQSTRELAAMQRKKAQEQLAGADNDDARLDALVRARLVDSTYRVAKEGLSRQLTATWGDDFQLTDRILR